ncbi:MAG: tyrosine-type recombinase/integrase [Clostridia bacterium]|nr:tyrosine-type recombinase/integrase [Clostridia bacterium]
MRHEISTGEFAPVIREYAGYKSAIQGCSQRTVEEYLLDLRTFFRWLLSRDDPAVLEDPEAFSRVDVKSVDLDVLRGITQGDVYDFLMYADSDRDNHSSAKARKLAAIRGLFKFLTAKRGYLTDDPTAYIDSPKLKKALPKVLSLEEALLLLDTVASDRESHHRVRDYTILTLFLNCGMRVSELVGISLTDLNPDLRSLRVVGKGNKERLIYLNDACRAALEAWLTIRLSPDYERNMEKALFLSNRGTRFSDKGVQHMVYKYLNMAGLGARRLSVHKLRHTAATLMYQSGEVDIRVLKDILGHEQLNTTQIYTHLSDQGMEQAMAHNPLNSLRPPSADDAPETDNGDDEQGE